MSTTKTKSLEHSYLNKHIRTYFKILLYNLTRMSPKKTLNNVVMLQTRLYLMGAVRLNII